MWHALSFPSLGLTQQLLALCLLSPAVFPLSRARYLNLPMFMNVTNVYVDGVYDLCHIGHKMQMQNALQFGNRLLVGLVSDENVYKYKSKCAMAPFPFLGPFPVACAWHPVCTSMVQPREGGPPSRTDRTDSRPRFPPPYSLSEDRVFLLF